MKTIEVKTCGDCNFRYSDDDGSSSCSLTCDETPETGRPEWCDLDKGPVVLLVSSGPEFSTDPLVADEQPGLRDRFAMAALPACVGMSILPTTQKAAEEDDVKLSIWVADMSYELADAMLEARKK